MPKESLLLTPKITEVLASRICHDLISPVSATNNGVEFLEEMGAEAGDDAIGLIAHSAKQSSNRLQIFRFAYAAGGSEKHVTLDDIETCFTNFIDGSRLSIDWQINNKEFEGMMPLGFCKIFLTLLLALLDMMPRGGMITTEQVDEHTLRLKTDSKNLAPQVDYLDCLTGKGSEQDLTPKNIHAYITYVFSNYFNIPYKMDEEGDISYIDISLTEK